MKYAIVQYNFFDERTHDLYLHHVYTCTWTLSSIVVGF